MNGAAAQSRSSETRALWWVIIAAVIAIPLTVIPSAKDPFRVPKELEFRALGIIVITIVIGLGWQRLADRRWRRELLVAGAACAWTATAMLFSVNRTLSVHALLTVIFSAAIFLATCVATQEQKMAPVSLVFLPAIVNALVMVSQALGLWSPFHDGESKVETALIGNRNDAGMYLLAPAIAAFVLAGVTRGSRRIAYAVLAVFLLTGLLATQTISAIIAYGAALVAFAIIAKREFIKPVAIAVIVTATVSAVALLSRSAADIHLILIPIKGKVRALRAGNLDLMTSHRLGASIAAWEMFADRPITGVGPGSFPFEYFSRWVEAEQRYPTLLSPYAARENYGEVHNDHLQVLAETGLVGYLIFSAAGVYIASLSFRRVTEPGRDTGRSEFARHLAFPLICGFAVLALGQFPIELAAPRITFIFFGAVCCGWSRE